MALHLLPIPVGFDPEGARFQCGPLMIEAALFKKTGSPFSGKPFLVKHSLLGGMLPSHVSAELDDHNIAHKVSVVAQQKGKAFLAQAAQQGKMVLLFTNTGIGHWIALWGYDEEKNNFLFLDSSISATRDSNGLSCYSYKQIEEKWKQVPRPLYPLQAIGYLHPYTAIEIY